MSDMTSIKRAGRITTFGFAIGAGLLIAAGAGTAVATAAPGDSGHTATSTSAASSGPASSARSARSSTGPAVKPKPRPKPTRAAGTRSESGGRVVNLTTGNRTPAVVSAAADLDTTPTPAAKPAVAKRIPTPARLPSPVDVVRDLNTLRGNIELLVRHQIEDLRDNLTMLRYDLMAIFGPARRPTNPDIPADETPGMIGKPRSREGYFIYQGATNTCALSAAAMLIGQLYGRDAMPTWEQIVDEASRTPSFSKPGEMVYNRPADGFVSTTDVLQLLQTHGVNATMTQYTRGQGATALENLKAALTAGDAVAVSVKAAIIWRSGAPDTAYTGDHLVTVLGIDTTKNVVYINDSAWKQEEGMGMALPMDVFLSGWAADSYLTVRAVAAVDSQSALAA